MPLTLRDIDIPPSWLALHIGAAWVLSLVSPPVFGAWGAVLGPGLVALGALVMVVAALQMIRLRTTVIPRRNPSALVTTGLFAWSRNPIYLADVLILLGAILWLDVALGLPLVASFISLIQARFIRDEEARLTETFGPEFDLWAARTRRWVGRR
ncbi:MAG: isoprenylcysteine carboxylmethyltransferase family protein [Tabrizicola sp.]|uniref:methyltransferase family protein n=1 Tax=Tabrizicola sp. TaxID=2005166 RepID=UPI002ABBF8DB|nr:isoprenylcysteine carboxylmethyltransferase family protein [Tabrizicola sp.]MDZ4087550.1 isoprenylcysteine carboxylmethyltransferase family protein [Tabrizicola sp.]